MEERYDYNPNDKKEWWEYILFAICCLLVAFMLTHCTTIKYVPVEKVVTKDSLIIKKEYVNNEVKVKEYVAGDTVYRDSIVIRVVYHSDTIYQSIRDSVPYPVPVVQEVERSLNTYEKTMIRLGWLFLGLILAFIAYKCIKLYIKSKVP